MKRSRAIFIIFFILMYLGIPSFAYSQQYNDSIKKLIVFYSPGYHRCIEVKSKVMPQIEKEFKGRIFIEYQDVADIENYKLMLGLKEKYNVSDIKDLPIFYSEGHFLDSKGEIENKLRAFIYEVLNMPQEKQTIPAVDLVDRFRTFKPLAIMGAGLIDGINPCAFTVMVFFISFLTLQGYRKKELVAIGLSFIFIIFLTYFLIGLGIFNFLYQLKGFWLVTRTVNICIGIFSIILGVLSICDCFKFRKTADTQGLLLQLPRSLKNRIHYVIGLHYRKTKTSQCRISRHADASASQGLTQQKHILRLVISAVLSGFLVSILEAVCTGQAYLPTITFILKTTHLKLQALTYLILYNFMFILPLLAIFMFALWGASSEQLSKFLKQHLLLIKILMAILFFSLGVFLVWRP